MTSESNNTSTANEQTAAPIQPIVQYILVRTDLNWTTGALIAQACHASVASIAESLDKTATKAYLSDIDNMRKIVLKTDKVEDLIETQGKLKEASIPHKLWIEQPENLPTCLAVSPQPKLLVQTIFKHLKLFK